MTEQDKIIKRHKIAVTAEDGMWFVRNNEGIFDSAYELYEEAEARWNVLNKVEGCNHKWMEIENSNKFNGDDEHNEQCYKCNLTRFI